MGLGIYFIMRMETGLFGAYKGHKRQKGKQGYFKRPYFEQKPPFLFSGIYFYAYGVKARFRGYFGGKIGLWADCVNRSPVRDLSTAARDGEKEPPPGCDRFRRPTALYYSYMGVVYVYIALWVRV